MAHARTAPLAIQPRMTNIPPIAREAMELARRGDLQQAIARAREAVEAHPQEVTFPLTQAGHRQAGAK